MRGRRPVFHLYWTFLPDAADALDTIGEFVRAKTAGVDERTSTG